MTDPDSPGPAAQPLECIPAWCEHWRGSGAILFVAPHGGRRPPVDALAPPPNLRVNDVCTPEITRMLAARLDAGAIINTFLDRNALDLNRTSQVRRRARWYLRLLVDEIEAVLAQHGAVEVIIVHGWNTGQPRCDLGIGGIETATGIQVPDGVGLTVSPVYLQTRLAALRAACARAGIQVSLGERYPASHPNNLLQLFTAHERHPEDAEVRQLAQWSRAGRINAWQLELGIPLRWRGEWRERFVEAMAEACSGLATEPQPGSTVPGPRPGKRQERSEPQAPTADPIGVQFYEPSADIGMFAGVGPIGPHSTGGRLLFFLGGQRVALFTGEEPRARPASVSPLMLTRAGALLRVAFDGPMLLLEDAAAYLDLEHALASSQLVDAVVDLDCRLGSGDQPHGAQVITVEGRVTLAGTTRAIQTVGFTNAGGLRGGGGHQIVLTAHFGAELSVLSRAGADGLGSMMLCESGQPRRSETARVLVTTNGDEFLPATFELRADDGIPLRAWPLSRMAILRGLGGGLYLRVTFGVARCQWGERQGYGMYEYAHAVPVAVAMPNTEHRTPSTD